MFGIRSAEMQHFVGGLINSNGNLMLKNAVGMTILREHLL